MMLENDDLGSLQIRSSLQENFEASRRSGKMEANCSHGSIFQHQFRQEMFSRCFKAPFHFFFVPLESAAEQAPNTTSDDDIKFYGGETICKQFSLSSAHRQF